MHRYAGGLSLLGQGAIKQLVQQYSKGFVIIRELVGRVLHWGVGILDFVVYQCMDQGRDLANDVV